MTQVMFLNSSICQQSDSLNLVFYFIIMIYTKPNKINKCRLRLFLISTVNEILNNNYKNFIYSQ